MLRNCILFSAGTTAVLEQYYRYGYYIAYLLCIFGFCMNLLRYTWGKVLFVILFGAGTLLTFRGTGANEFVYLFLFLICANQVSSIKIMEFSLAVRGICIAAVVLSSQVGMIEDHMFDVHDRSRHGLGFKYTTYSAILYSFVILIYIYLRREQMMLLEYVLLSAFGYYLFRMTDSRMAFLVSNLAMLFFYLLGRLPGGFRRFLLRLRHLYLLVPFIFAGISVYASYAYSDTSGFWVRINEILSKRLELQSAAVKKYNWTAFGQKIEWVGHFSHGKSGKEYNFIDNSFVHVGLENGLLYLFLVLVLYSILIYRAYRLRDLYLIWTVLFVLLLSLTEPRLIELTYNPFPLLFFSRLEVPQKHDFSVSLIWNVNLRAVKSERAVR